MAPFEAVSGRAPARSVSACGRAIVRMPSWTCPMLSKTPIAVHMTQPDMVTTRSARPVAIAMSPSVTAPRIQSHTASAPTQTSRTLLLLETVTFRSVIRRVWRRNAAV